MTAANPSEIFVDASPEADEHYCAIAILDVVGFSSLMGENQQRTYDRFGALRTNVIDPMTSTHNGRHIKSTGDGVLATFEKAADALNWAQEVQRRARVRGEGLRVRIALHYGRVIVAPDGDVFGDCVNVAARLESHALPGGVILTQNFLDALPEPNDLQLTSTGVLKLKNIAKNVIAFHLSSDARDFAAAARTGQKTSRLPTIAVLPFASDEADSHFASGAVEDLIASLSGVQELNVIAYSTVRALGADVSLNPRDIGEAFGADYILSGALQHSKTKLRIETELLDAATGRAIASDRTLFDATELFAAQDQLVEMVVGRVAPEVKRATLLQALRKPPTNFTSYEHMLYALELVASLDRDEFETARTHLENAVAEDPGFSSPRAWLARWFTLRVGQGWSSNPGKDSQRALSEAQHAIRLDRRNALALATFGHVTAYSARDYDTAINYHDRAVAAGPNNAIANALRSVTLSFLGRAKEARAAAERALRLSPFDEQLFQFFSFLGLACYVNGDYEEAAIWAKRSLAENPNYTNTLKLLVVTMAAVGDLEAARRWAGQLIALEPNFRVSRYRSGPPPFKRTQHTRDLIAHYSAAGLPE